MSRSIVFIVNKNNDEFVQFNFPENEESYFDALKRGNYKLTLYDNNTNVVYPIALTGDNYTDSSNEEEYDLSKTEIYPLIINGIAGETNIINVEFRAKDGLRWNYLVEISNFKMTNSQNLDTKDIDNFCNLFSGCSSLEDITALQNWNVSNGIKFQSMFSGCQSLKDLPNLSKWKISNKCIKSNVFDKCSSLKISDIQYGKIFN